MAARVTAATGRSRITAALMRVPGTREVTANPTQSNPPVRSLRWTVTAKRGVPGRGTTAPGSS